VAAVDPVTFDHDALQYRAWVVTGTSAVVLERQLVLRAGTVDGNSLRELDAVVQRILEHERTPIVLRAASGTR
jgi:hypothetical protein